MCRKAVNQSINQLWSLKNAKPPRHIFTYKNMTSLTNTSLLSLKCRYSYVDAINHKAIATSTDGLVYVKCLVSAAECNYCGQQQ